MNEPFSAESPRGSIVDILWDALLFPYYHITFEFETEHILNYGYGQLQPRFWASEVSRI